MPFVIPVRTGIWLMDGTAESSGNSEITSLLTHAEVCLRMRLPNGKFFRISWYQGIEGFTGWHSGAPWRSRLTCTVRGTSLPFVGSHPQQGVLTNH
jgi:hypothetical protein